MTPPAAAALLPAGCAPAAEASLKSGCAPAPVGSVRARAQVWVPAPEPGRGSARRRSSSAASRSPWREIAPPPAVSCREARTPREAGAPDRHVRCPGMDAAPQPEVRGRRMPWRVIFRVLLLLATAVSLYFLFPSLVDLFTQWHSLAHLQPWWLLLAVIFEATSVTALWEVQRIALRTP